MKKFVLAHKVGELETTLVMGDVRYHRELLDDNEGCYGGGFYIFDNDKKICLLYGESFDFGFPLFDEVDLTAIPEYLKDYKLVYVPNIHCSWDENDIIDTTNIKYY